MELDRTSVICFCFFFFKQKTAYEMRISDWSSDVCSSDLSSLISPQGHPHPAFHLSRYSKAQKRRVRLFGKPAIRSARNAIGKTIAQPDRQKKRAPFPVPSSITGGVDGTRTRDLRRARPAF